MKSEEASDDNMRQYVESRLVTYYNKQCGASMEHAIQLAKEDVAQLSMPYSGPKKRRIVQSLFSATTWLYLAILFLVLSLLFQLSAMWQPRTFRVEAREVCYERARDGTGRELWRREISCPEAPPPEEGGTP